MKIVSPVKTILGLIVLTCTFMITHGQAQATNESLLSLKQQTIIPIAALTAQGDLQRLKPALNKGLESGLTVSEIKEILVHTYAYCGFPRSIRSLQTFMEVLDERIAKGITDQPGAEASPITDEGSKYEQGKANLEKLVGRSLPEIQSGYAAFAPVIEVFLKEHLFADLFQRDVLTFAERELVTISVIAAIGKAEPMLRSHMAICLNVGYSREQLNEFILVLKTSVGEQSGSEAQAVLDELVKNE